MTDSYEVYDDRLQDLFNLHYGLGELDALIEELEKQNKALSKERARIAPRLKRFKKRRQELADEIYPPTH